MSYSVDWTDNALVPLAALWVLGPDRQDITAAQSAIDRRLALDPLQGAEHIAEGLYATEFPPLRAVFEIDRAEFVVTVVAIRRVTVPSR